MTPAQNKVFDQLGSLLKDGDPALTPARAKQFIPIPNRAPSTVDVLRAVIKPSPGVTRIVNAPKAQPWRVPTGGQNLVTKPEVSVAKSEAAPKQFDGAALEAYIDSLSPEEQLYIHDLMMQLFSDLK